MTFSLFPPEFNSQLIYTARDSAQVSPAVFTWEALAAGLCSTSDSLRPMISALTTNWNGPWLTEITSAAGQYASWLNATVAQITDVAAKAKAAASALETAFAMTVPPLIVEANRAWFKKLAMTNLFAQDSQAVAATEAHYLEMWAQDATAMNAYVTAWADTVRMSAYGKPAGAAACTGGASSRCDAANGGVLAPTTDSSAEVRWALSSLTAPVGPASTAVPDEPVGVAGATERRAVYPISTLPQANRICESGAAALTPAGDAPTSRCGHPKGRTARAAAGGVDYQQRSWGLIVSAHTACAMVVGGLSVPPRWRAEVGEHRDTTPPLPTTTTGPRHRRQAEHAAGALTEH